MFLNISDTALAVVNASGTLLTDTSVAFFSVSYKIGAKPLPLSTPWGIYPSPFLPTSTQERLGLVWTTRQLPLEQIVCSALACLLSCPFSPLLWHSRFLLFFVCFLRPVLACCCVPEVSESKRDDITQDRCDLKHRRET